MLFSGRKFLEPYPTSDFIELDPVKQEKLKKFRESHPQFDALVEQGLKLIHEKEANDTQSKNIRDLLWKIAVIVSIKEAGDEITKDYMKIITDLMVQSINSFFPEFAGQVHTYITNEKLFDHLLNGRK